MTARGRPYLRPHPDVPQTSPMERVDELITEARNGTPDAVNRLFKIAYADLHDLAHQRLRRSASITVLDTTVLVHECYLRLAKLGHFRPEDRTFFLGYAARAMRSIVIDLLRQRSAAKHGGDAIHVTLAPDEEDPSLMTGETLLRVNNALEDLAVLDPRLVTVVEMKFFAGLTFEQIAAALGMTERTVRRDWQKARLVLYSALQS